MESYSMSYGAVLLGSLIASTFSGFVALQVVLYFKLFPKDEASLKALVLAVWAVDITHTILVWASAWEFMVAHFANPSYVDHIPVPTALTVVVTAIVTVMSHCFFAHRIYRLSHHKWYLVAPVVMLSLARLGCATVSSVEMIKLKSLSLFKARFDYRFLFSLGLAFSSIVDVLITSMLFFLLKKSKTSDSSSRLNWIIDTSIMYTFEIGTLTGVTTVSAMTCWLAMHSGLVFLGIHFAIAKLYANSLMTSLNTRQHFRHARAAPVTAIDWFNTPLRSPVPIDTSRGSSQACAVQVDVSKSVQYHTDP